MSDLVVKRYTGSKGIPTEDAEVIGAFIDKQFGDDPVTPKQMVDAARPKRSEIHGYFEWDDSVAGEQWRMQQARKMLGAIVIVYERPDGSEVKTRAFHHVHVVRVDDADDVVDDTRGFVPARVVWSSPELSQAVLADARRQLQAWIARFKEYRDLSDAVSRVQMVIDEELTAA